MVVELLVPAGVMGALGLVLAAVLLAAAKRFYVYEDPRIDQIEDLLPGANCGGCGKAGFFCRRCRRTDPAPFRLRGT